MQCVCQFFFAKWKFEITSENISVQSVFKIFFRKRKFELAPKNTFGEKSYPCNLCIKIFVQSGSL